MGSRLKVFDWFKKVIADSYDRISWERKG